ncbi:cobalt-precorrin-5B (C(1))-methyltransferase CbiD [Candidatus Desulfovibrio trichonymphae]|uniref:Cobalt-precorrin-5B C(1)-methyltransferase n=1 Tax=Candidatus Desulfovibrio trichonymphae TaxID=1725232 RepID=A0A1J1DR49_9BACT|nr:cobalt-precorrin-5B (C(1))-methyltransferase CbiD [Candidatus Desulfovibrio trichonymphae]BAV92327.1 cobalt-precorrin-5B (C1)-methyltransferase [Candidatus Desulfovibrio trichonymphae]GHU97946.1 cobalt-precorrin-5B C(1)-methyltransferase [Deltaproteobacteria bacterium]
MKPAVLREGFTTGTAAAGAALAALTLLREGHAPTSVSVPLPPFLPPEKCRAPLFAGRCCAGFATLPVESCARLLFESGEKPPGALQTARAAVRKDGGDDPDVTSGALITADVTLHHDTSRQYITPEDDHFIHIAGGPGVGRVTLPGLPVPPGEAAINPTPREQLRFALGLHAAQTTRRRGPCPPLTVIVSVPQGEELARHTLNLRLGIVGGISILGTQGTVRPFSNSAWQVAITHGLAVAHASGCDALCFSTGRRSEKLLMAAYPDLTPQAFIQAADFVEFSLKSAGAMPFKKIIWGCFFGKLLKLSQGISYTHACEGKPGLNELVRLCSYAGADCAGAVDHCTTAAQALELLLTDAAGSQVIARVMSLAAEKAERFAGRPVRLHLFHTDGRALCAA